VRVTKVTGVRNDKQSGTLERQRGRVGTGVIVPPQGCHPTSHLSEPDSPAETLALDKLAGAWEPDEPAEAWEPGDPREVWEPDDPAEA
jgi:hypothetical protein